MRPPREDFPARSDDKLPREYRPRPREERPRDDFPLPTEFPLPLARPRLRIAGLDLSSGLEDLFRSTSSARVNPPRFRFARVPRVRTGFGGGANFDFFSTIFE